MLRSIAKYNDHSIEIQHADVQMDDGAAKPVDETEMKDKKDSELPTPDAMVNGSRSPISALPRDALLDSDGSTSTIMYDSVGIGRPPPKRAHPIRTGSAFYAETPAHERLSNEFERSFASEAARQSQERLEEADEGEDEDGEGRRKLLRSQSAERLTRGGVKGRARNRAGSFAWWFQWVEQLKKLFTKQWRRTVILMWIIWGSMSFGESRIQWAGAGQLIRRIHNVQCLAAGGP